MMHPCSIRSACAVLAVIGHHGITLPSDPVHLNVHCMPQDADRVESGKAAAAAMVGGAAAALPILLVQAEPGLSGALTLAASLATCALFGVTYRYAVRDDVGDSHLRGGVVAAFGLVRALGGADILQATSDNPFAPEVVGPAALYALQSVVVVGFAAAAVEAALTNGFVKRLKR